MYTNVKKFYDQIKLHATNLIFIWKTNLSWDREAEKKSDNDNK